MRKLRFGIGMVIACCALAGAGAASGAAAQDAAPDATAEARAAAEAWLALMDADQAAEAWEQAASSFQGAVTADQWRAQANAVRGQVGAVEEREFSATRAMTDPPGAPRGDYVQIIYESRFATAGALAEIVIAFRDGDRGWRVAGYFVQPAQ